MHNWPGFASGSFAVHDGPVMACADRFDIEIRGHGAHAAMPHLGVDPVAAGAALVQALQTVSSRTIDPTDAVVVSVTQFHAGEAYNVIPDRAILRHRAPSSPRLRARRRDHADDLRGSGGGGANVNFEYRRGYPPTINSAQAGGSAVAEAAAEVAGSAMLRTD